MCVFLALFARTIQWAVLSVVNLLFGLVAVLLFNWWLPFVTVPIKGGDYLDTADGCKWRGLERLPTWLKWFDTFDASIDAGWLDGYFEPKGAHSASYPPNFWLRKYYQWKWLQRNTGYGFAYWPLGIEFDQGDWDVHTARFDADGSVLFVATSWQGYWCIGYGGKWGSYSLGWKAKNYWWPGDNKWSTNPWGPEWRTQIVMSINPFKRS